jgi:hypothetical protein
MQGTQSSQHFVGRPYALFTAFILFTGLVSECGPSPAAASKGTDEPSISDIRVFEERKFAHEDSLLLSWRDRLLARGDKAAAARFIRARELLHHRPAGPADVAREMERITKDVSVLYTTSLHSSTPTSGPNIGPYVPVGWSFDVVPRSDTVTAGATLLPPDSLKSGIATTYVNTSGSNLGDASTGVSFTDSLLIDGTGMKTQRWNAWDAGVVGTVRNLGPFAVPGGRHTLTLLRDAGREVSEADESDNKTEVQYVWAPTALLAKIPQSRAHPPARGSGPFPNADGFQCSATWWAAIGIIPATGGDDVDISLYTDYVGATDGYSTIAATSAAGPGLSDVVILNGNAAGYGLTVYPAVTSASGTGNGYQIEMVGSDSTFERIGHFGPYTFGSGGVLRIYEILLAPGSYAVRLKNESGANLDLAVLPSNLPYMRKSDALAYAGGGGAGSDESLYVTIPTQAYYALLVEKHGTSDISQSATYEIYLDNTAPAITGPAVTPVGWSTTNAFTFTWSATDPETGVRFMAYRTNGAETKASVATVSGAFAYQQGANTFSVKATNWAGETSAWSSVTFNYDSGAPTSSVSPLASTLVAPEGFPVAWSGADPVSGLASYDVQYRSVPNGVWTDWKTGTQETSSTFGPILPDSTIGGRTYAFRVRAHDTAGNVEAWPADSLGDAWTTLEPQVGAPPEERDTEGAVGGARFHLAIPEPQPARHAARIAYSLDGSVGARLDVWDAGGRRIRTLMNETREPGGAVLRWNLTDEQGAAVPSGVYVVQLVLADGRRATRTLVVLR